MSFLVDRLKNLIESFGSSEEQGEKEIWELWKSESLRIFESVRKNEEGDGLIYFTKDGRD